MKQLIVKALREPLLHFLIAGACLFLLSHWMRSEPPRLEGDREFVVTRAKIETLAENFRRLRQRPPTAAELDGLIEDFIREEILCREAVALGLDRDDTVVRRRLRQKMEFLAEDVSVPREPSEDELEAYLHENQEAFRIDARLSFTHVYLNPEARGESIEADAQKILAQLQDKGDSPEAIELGDGLGTIEAEQNDLTERDVESLFGQEFAKKLLTLPTGQWQGPVHSGYGLHFVFIGERIDGRLPDLSSVRGTVAREWRSQQQREGTERFYQSRRKRYNIVIEEIGPTPVDDTASVSGGDQESEGEPR